MINIRSITYNLPKNLNKEHFNIVRKNAHYWNLENYFIRTKRISLAPVSKPMSFSKIHNINTLCNECDIRWFNVSLNPWDSQDKTDLFQFGYEVLKKFPQSFVNINCIKDGKFDIDIIKRSIKLMRRVSQISINGKDNFRFGISSNIEHDCPFFPFSSSSGVFSFSIALELTQEINEIIQDNKKLNIVELREKIISVIKTQIDDIYLVAQRIAKETGLQFKGFDFSLAPIIDKNGSIITILRHLGVKKFGSTGTMFATAYLTNILKKFSKMYPSVGFSGVMYSLLEDLELCNINNQQGVKLEDLIKLSTMCGCGIDMVPISFDTSDYQLKTAIMEIGAISTRLKKPLGIRFLPIPNTNSQIVSYTNFNEDADFIANTKVLSLTLDNDLNDNELAFFEFIEN